jgi:hypothetical protein
MQISGRKQFFAAKAHQLVAVRGGDALGKTIEL